MYFILALDPIHVGRVDTRLGCVDLTIVREPGTNLPKILSTSISGATRTYAAMQENCYRWQVDGKTYVYAGQGQENKDKNIAGHCGQPTCPICVTFGFSKGSRASFQGLAQFSDARLLFFPVHSLAGPVWVTCPEVLKDLRVTAVEPNDEQVHVASGVKTSGKLNLGWLMLDVASNNFAPQVTHVPQEILDRSVLVSNKMFGHIVNDNLEVRTSVSIDPQTGAAADKSLFTYEALPRASVLYFDVIVTDPKFYQINGKQPLSSNGGKRKVIETVNKGLTLFESLGIGGMNTRGMGRLRVLNLSAGGAQ